MAVLSNELRLRRGTEEQHKKFIGSLGEVTVVTTENDSVGSPSRYILSVHDGETPGGHFLASMRYVDGELYEVRDKLYQIDNRLKEEFLTREEANSMYMSADKVFTEEDIPQEFKERIELLDTNIEYFKNFEKRLKSYNRDTPSGATQVGYTASAEFFDLRDEHITEPEIDENGNIVPTIVDVQKAIDALASWNKNLARRIDDGVIDQKINEALNKLIDGAPEAMDTLKELAELLGNADEFTGSIMNKLNLIQRGTATLNSREGTRIKFEGKLKHFVGKDYTVTVTPVSICNGTPYTVEDEGYVGEIWVKKGVNSFTIYNSAPSSYLLEDGTEKKVNIKVDYIIIGD